MGSLGNCKWPNCGCAGNACMYNYPEEYAEQRVKEACPKPTGHITRTVVLDIVWVIAYPDNKGMIYHPPGVSASEAWRNCMTFLASFEKRWQKKNMLKEGFRARRVSVQFEVISNG